MLTETNRISAREKLTQLWPEFGGELLALLDRMNSAGVRPILFNLPLNYDLDKSPSDLDMILEHSSYVACQTFLEEDGAIRLTHRPGTNQTLYLVRLNQNKWFRIHLHSDLSFMGVKLATYEQMERFCMRNDNLLVPGPELDQFLLHIQWFFKRKNNYSGRIESVQKMIDETRERGLLGHLPARVDRLYRRCLNDRRNGREVSAGYKLSVALNQTGWLWPLARTIIVRTLGALGSLLPLKRRGLFVYLMGIDGTGKTSLAKRLVKSHKTGLIAKYRYLGLKVTLVQKVRSRLLGQNERERFDGQSGVADKLATKSSLAANLFNLILSFAYIADYAVRLHWALRFVRKDNNLLAVDRAHFDKLTERHKWGNSLFYTLLPKPDLVIGLAGDTVTLYARKQEFEPEILAKMQVKMEDVWTFLATKNIPFRRIDSTKNDPDKCVRLINEKIWQLINPDS